VNGKRKDKHAHRIGIEIDIEIGIELGVEIIG
jgi:hypothetical protein